MALNAHEIQRMTLSGLNLIKQAISIYDADLRLVIANRRFQEMFGLPEEFVSVGAGFEETIRFLAQSGEYGEIDDLDTYINERIEQARTFEPHYFERDRNNGTRISVEGSPLRQGGWVAVYTDITEIRKQEEMLRGRTDELSGRLLSRTQELSKTNRELEATITALEEAKNQIAESESRAKMTAEMTPAHIARVDITGVYTYSNNKLDTVLPNNARQIIGKHFSEVLGDHVYSKIQPHFEKALQGKPSVFEFSLEDSDHRVRVALTPDINDKQQVTGSYVLSTNITEEYQAQQALAHTRRRELAAQLTSGLAHDFANLLTIILGQQNKLEAMADLSEQIRDTVDVTKSAALRGGALLEGLSGLTSQRNLQPKPVQLSEFFAGLSPLAQAAINPDIELTIHLSGDIENRTALLDPGFLQDALLNLIINASEAIDGHGHIGLSARSKGNNRLVFSVEDDGPGFSTESLENAFSPFYSTKSGAMGRGLGLTTVFDFAKLCGGRVDKGNREQGGAFVTLSIPLLESRPIEPGLVLLVEDTDEIRETVRGYLRDLGHSVLEASTIDEAMALGKIAELRYVITDLMFAGKLTGLDLARRLRADGIELPILIITGLPVDDEVRQRAAQDFPILSKPFTITQLEAFFLTHGATVTTHE